MPSASTIRCVKSARYSGAGQWALCLAPGLAAGYEKGNTSLGNGSGEGLWGTPAPPRYPPVASGFAPERARRGPAAFALGQLAAGVCTRCKPRPCTPRTTYSTHGLRCALTACLTNPSLPGLIKSGCSTARTCPWLLAVGPLGEPSKTRAPRTSWASTGGCDARRTSYYGPVTGLFAQPPTPNLLVHSDQDGQYGGSTYRALLHQHGAARSQSSRKLSGT